jgi:hypothetical protein
MRALNYSVAVFVIVLGAGRAYSAGDQSAGAGTHVNLYASAKDIKWGPAPPVVPSGAQAVVLDGNPFASSGSYTLRLKMPAGYRIPPHWHPTDENVTVLSGTLGAGMGDTFNKSNGTLLKAGGFVCMPKDVHHYAWAQGPTTIQVHGLAPFAFTYVNPADDPRNAH